MNTILTTAATVGGMGIACGTALAMAARFLAVTEDPRIEQATDILPGANCGGCGFAGCADYAKAVVLDGADITLCAPGSGDTVKNLSALLGVEATTFERKVALVLCDGTIENAHRKSLYNGIADCTAAASVNGGDKACAYGCLGYGSCLQVCPSNAIELVDGIARVHPDLCIGCTACVRICPRKLIKMVPESKNIHVLCNSKAKGPITKKACKVGCIGCRACTKVVEDEAITMDGFLAIVDYDKEINDTAAVEKCPANCIKERKLT